ncbi:hypothetical protein [Nocardia testacea]|uniref:hypothetical protein n=1 Tax=Nocardia testacea TaxID=248551 RepID=UPI0033E06644
MIGRALHNAEPALQAVIASHALDTPSDGDCLTVSPRVTEALVEHGLQAQTASVAGWLDPSATILGFLHQVTVCDGFVLDGTARQFSTLLPAAWVAPIVIYLRDLAEATHTSHVAFVDV